MLRFSRTYATKPLHQLKCGIEIHTQLNTKSKLFSLSSNNAFNSDPNTFISYFDIGLPGTQPKLNNEALLYALKLSKALQCDVNLDSSFDRKHYFYGDQPLGYQITQHFSPIAKNGKLEILPELDGVKEPLTVEIEQLQIEQDTGKSVYVTETATEETVSKIDLNRANLPLIEMVTKPNFTDSNQVKVFIKKFQNLVRYLDICTGDLETGAMRIDVNVSVDGFQRVELKNLSTTSSVMNAIKYEFQRQVKLIEAGRGDEIIIETRGWDGSKTNSLRNKESSLDYKYFPDPELPHILLDKSVMEELQLPELPDQVLSKLINKPYSLSLKDATILTYDLDLLRYYLDLFDLAVISNGVKNSKLPGNFVIHEILGNFSKLNMRFDPELIPVAKINELVQLIDNGTISNSSAKLLLQHLFNNNEDISRPLSELIDEFDLRKEETVDNDQELVSVCQEIINENEKTVKNLKKKPNGLKFLVGQAMRVTQGKVNAAEFERVFKGLLNVE
ncbi:hypothetical protein WICPIJ_000391 [Wickerhamomyces pijperi]|uniref:Glutamyl-tRNA(Gln) amidotransferase subunit B, mitochondrial n=1 Tax=Wickerhamomyces pijperi TaxID=599730 RepID=A0A9P8QH57_WICPI|nr:hypothetical protein WICPIJ_000391 [Wickerhamomyces pijperi]